MSSRIVHQSRFAPSVPTTLLVGGAISLLSVTGQMASLMYESDLSTPTGRFRAMASAIEHFAPVLGASALLVGGCRYTGGRGIRRAVGICLLLIGVVCLVTIPSIVPDARQLAAGVLPIEVSRFRGQVIRALLYVIATMILLIYLSWRVFRPLPVTNPEAG